jgi:hypothetical protein
MHVATIIDIN